MNIVKEIKSKLIELERTQAIKILFAVESGSRAWGFPSKDSDYDVRFVYLRHSAWYLSVQQRRDVIEIPINDQLDFSGWDIQKALYLIGKCNPALMEWLHSPMVYIETSELETLRDLAKRFFHPRIAMYHYLHMAEGNYRESLQGEKVRLKKYLYVLRPLLACEWLEQHHSMPPIEMSELVKNSKLVPKNELANLIEKKMQGFEIAEGPRIEALNNFIEKQLGLFSNLVRVMPKVRVTYDELDEVFFRLVWTGKSSIDTSSLSGKYNG